MRLRWIAALALTLALGCKGAGAPPPLDAGALPETAAQVDALKKGGASWTNAEARADYLRLVAAIGPANERWKREGVPAEERARRAFQMRHDARLTTRAMMTDPAEVAALEQRDQAKYGHPDGPTFAELTDKERKKGREGDAVWEAIVESAQRTDQGVNEMLGLDRQR